MQIHEAIHRLRGRGRRRRRQGAIGAAAAAAYRPVAGVAVERVEVEALQVDPLQNRTQVVAQVQRPRGLDARQDLPEQASERARAARARETRTQRQDSDRLRSERHRKSNARSMQNVVIPVAAAAHTLREQQQRPPRLPSLMRS